MILVQHRTAMTSAVVTRFVLTSSTELASSLRTRFGRLMSDSLDFESSFRLHFAEFTLEISDSTRGTFEVEKGTTVVVGLIQSSIEPFTSA